MKLETVLYDVKDGVGVLRLNRPERMNAVIEQMYLDIRTVLQEAEKDKNVNALVLTGTVWKREKGDKQAFCAGADLKKHAAGERTPLQKREYILLAHDVTREVHDFEKPVIAAVNGPARGAGAEMAVACDFILMADSATIAFPESGLGTCVGGGVTYNLVQAVGQSKAKWMVYTGTVLDGPAAVDFGLAMASHPLETFMDRVMEFARTLANKAPYSMKFSKYLLQNASHLDLPAMLQLEADAILGCMTTEDWQEGIDAFAQKRPPRFKGK